jgi:DNA (cytosine-5)-methyltransferase 1
MTVTGLFAGIGGFELAFADAGFKPGLLVEIDPAARAVLQARFPDAELRTDVLKLKDLPSETTILTAGFPCQNLSMAGDKSGIDGSKTGIVKKLFELIARSHVPTVVIENVYFMLHLNSGMAMTWLVERFEKLKYKWAYRVLNTMAFGLPQRRRRVYFVASLDMDPRAVLFADRALEAAAPAASVKLPLGFYWTEGRSGVGLTIDGIPPLKVGSSIGIASQPAVLFPDGEVLIPSLVACERLQGFAPGWTAPVAAVGSPRRSEWRLVGNAVSVPVARWVAGRLKSPGQILEFERVVPRAPTRWVDAGWNVGEGRVWVRAGDQPILMPRPSIATFRDATWARLSHRALDGFVERAVEGGLQMPKGFLAALRRAKRKAATGSPPVRRRPRNSRPKNVVA